MKPVQHENDFQRGMSNLLVAINKRMIEDQGEAERTVFDFDAHEGTPFLAMELIGCRDATIAVPIALAYRKPEPHICAVSYMVP